MPGGFNKEWSEYVKSVLTKHGATLRSQRQRTGLSHTTVSGWLQGVNPSLQGAIAFIRGFDEDEAEGLRAAGYDALIVEPGEAGREPAPDSDTPDWIVHAFEGSEDIPEGDREEIAAAVRALIEAKRRRLGLGT